MDANIKDKITKINLSYVHTVSLVYEVLKKHKLLDCYFVNVLEYAKQKHLTYFNDNNEGIIEDIVSFISTNEISGSFNWSDTLEGANTWADCYRDFTHLKSITRTMRYRY